MAARFKRYYGWLNCMGKNCSVETDSGWIKYETIKVDGENIEKITTLCDECHKGGKNVVKSN